MTDQKLSLSERVKPFLQQAKPWLKRVKQWAIQGLELARRWIMIAARETWIVLRRLPIASYSFYRALTSADYAHQLTDIYIDGASSMPVSKLVQKQAPQAPPPPPAAVLQEAGPDSALVLLSLLQNEGRFIDFLQEDVAGYADHEVGAAARVVHDGCRRVLTEHLSIAPVRQEAEGSQVTLSKGFDPAAVKPTGNVIGDPPFTGALVHRGWLAVDVRLPQVASSRDVRILAAAEVEL